MDNSPDSHLQMMTTWRVACLWIPFCRSSRTSALKGASVKTLRTMMMKMRRKTKKRMTITSTRRPSRNRTRIDSPSSKSAIQNTRSHLKTTLLMLRIRRRRSPL